MATSSKLTWVAGGHRQGLEVATAEPAQGYHSRREHTKSRNGCWGCKQRRIKVRWYPFQKKNPSAVQVGWDDGELMGSE